ncbi:MAG: type I-E CRISPR-associated protein Cas5/CasD [Desulfobulbaceae bacterium]|nr:type I-E CRISPR-associated protein Cas5/CasD [Desulfobulbaceae bacterium]
MSSEKRFLVLRLVGPLQSWGFNSQYNRRDTSLMPTKSAIAGICCAALGLHRGSEEERQFLKNFGTFQMTTIALPRLSSKKKNLPVRRLQDYHTVQNSRRASGAMNTDCVLTHRTYLNDSAFGIILEGDGNILAHITDALANPRWGIWLGRKACIPSAPVLAGLKDNRKDAVALLIGETPLELFTRQEEVETFADGRDSLPDNPISFASDKRTFAPRRIRTKQAGEK